MDVTSTLKEIKSLTVDERIGLVEAIWETIVAETGEPKLTEAQREELERRLAAHERCPNEVVSWDEVKAQALKRSAP